MPIRQPLRVQTLQVFTALRQIRAGWAGALVLGVGLRDGGRALALASLGVGAAGLFLEDDPTALRAAQREGCCTFVVTTLDEALRALKNEVRQGRAITVGLSGDPAQWLTEMEARGVLPAVLAAESPVSIAIFEGWGARPMHGPGLAQLNDVSIDLDEVLERATKDRWALRDDIATSMMERRVRDADLRHDYGEGDAVAEAMREWLRVAPSLFPRDLVRSRWVATD
jgi:hypothetical protein